MPPSSADVIAATTLETPIGPLSLLADGDHLVGGGFTAGPGELHARLHPSLRALDLTERPPDDLPLLVKPVRDYFDGDLGALDGLAVYQPATAARQRLLAALRGVAHGTTVSYTELAQRAGCPQAPRAAGAACAGNLIAPIVPCHRVLRTDGSLGGYYYGIDRKAWLLRHEGVRD
jgi:methylated-DNA-[protein]-cysteine S-methyltransferase